MKYVKFFLPILFGLLVVNIEAKKSDFAPNFTVIYSPTDPKLAAKPAGIAHVPYNVAVWHSIDSTNTLQHTQRKKDHFGDGFDDQILSISQDMLTPEVAAAGQVYELKARCVRRGKGCEIWVFAPCEVGQLSAERRDDELKWKFIPSKKGFYSIAYTGAPSCNIDEADEIWQPLIWQELRVPQRAYMTLAYRCPIPTTLLSMNEKTIGVVADSSEFPFNPLPNMMNSRFGVTLRTMNGRLQPQLYAPVLGGAESYCTPNQPMTFKVHLYESNLSLSQAYEQISRELCGFHNYRVNMDISLNATMDNMIDYAMSRYSMFIDSLKGCNYSTDAPGAVKNVSSLHPLQISMITNRNDILEERAYPMIEYMISREKFLLILLKKYNHRLVNSMVLVLPLVNWLCFIKSQNVETTSSCNLLSKNIIPRAYVTCQSPRAEQIGRMRWLYM